MLFRRKQKNASRARRFAGWRRVALINVSILAVILLAFIVLVTVSSLRAGGLRRALVLFSGDCDTSDRIDTGLHLLLNAFSTAIVASSNYFMQVLSAPSRGEIDAAHKGDGFLHIGVPSLRNFFGVSKWKSFTWIVLALASIPIHLLFNAAIFATDWRDSEYHLTIAAEGFVHGDPFFVPGASLSPAGISQIYSSSYPSSYGETYNRTLGFSNSIFDLPVTFLEYVDPSSPAWGNITSTATNGASWVRLDRLDCARRYTFACQGLRDYRNLLLVIDRDNASWARDEVWDFDAITSGSWDYVLPASDDNSLWYAAYCRMTPNSDMPGFPLPRTGEPTTCQHTCEGLMTSDGKVTDYESNWIIDFFPETVPEPLRWDWASSTNKTEIGIRPGKDLLRVDYCLAQPLTRECKVGLSNTLLFSVMICVCIKFAASLATFWVLRKQESLVTLGDAIQSFITTPDANTKNGNVAPWAIINTDGKYDRFSSGVRLVRSRRKPMRVFSVVPWYSWLLLSALLLVGISFTMHLAMSEKSTMSAGALASLFNSIAADHDATFGHDGAKEPTEMLTQANAPQLVLTIWYFTYNHILTHMCMAREWASYSSSYLPLRVTHPRGRQTSRYFLELPYRYGIPLIASSIMLHWLTSSSFYAFIGQGGYFTSAPGPWVWDKNRYESANPSIPENSVVAFRFSSAGVLLVTCCCIAMAILLVVLSMRKVHGHMPLVGTNFRAIAASCHVSPLSKVGDTETDLIIPGSTHITTTIGEEPRISSIGIMRMLRRMKPREGKGKEKEEDETEYRDMPPEHARLTRISRDLLSWGIVKMPEEWYAEHNGALTAIAAPGPALSVTHASFGTPRDGVVTPRKGRWYCFR